MTIDFFAPPRVPEGGDPGAWIADAAVRPAAEPQLREILPAALTAVGVPPDAGSAPPLPPGAPGLRLPSADRVVVVLVDGLGVHNLALRTGHAPFLRRLLQSSPTDPATGLPSARTCAPSTTAAAVTSFGTGAPPGEHGMVGYEVRDPVTGAPVSLISWQGATVTPRGVQEVPTLAERVAGRADLVSITPAAFVGTGLTEAALRGWRPRTAETLPDRVDATVAALQDGARAVYLYWGEVDHTGHGRGWTSDAWVAELEHVDAELGRLAVRLGRLPGDTLLVVTADHGMIDATRRHEVTAHPGLLRDVAVVAGDLRAPHLHLETTPGRRPEPGRVAEVAARWREHFAGRGVDALVLTREALARRPAADDPGAGLLGPLGRSADTLIGDLVVFLGGADVVVDPRTQSPGYRAMPGVHGSLSAQEIYVPLLTEVL